MGTFHVRIEIGDPTGARWQGIDAIVDTGASYTFIPRPILERLHVTAQDRFPFVLADGTQIERDIAETRVRLNGTTRTTIVIFGDDNAPPLLGAYTLEAFRLAVDPVNRRLISVPGLLVTATGRAPVDPAVLQRLRELLAWIGRALPKEEVPRFLQTAQPLLRGYRPIDLLDSEYSFRDLVAFVDAAKSGDMA